ncbi:MAG: GNAT family N-acetyltransferase, partial [Notoacmeibacter sp.]
MSRFVTLENDRLRLRAWQDADRKDFAKMNADPRVMEFFPKLLSEDESNNLVDRIQMRFAENGFGLWALEVIGVAPFVGFTGLSWTKFDAPFTPAVEIGWRLAHEHWGKGYATRAAKMALEHGLDSFGLSEVVSFTAKTNLRSQAVMAKIGMQRDFEGNFDHPSVEEGHPLRPHVL